MKKVMVFGVFDGLHAGHRSLFAQAKNLGDHLTVVATQDHVVTELKNHPPDKSLEVRLGALQAAPQVDLAVAGDQELGTWAVVKKYRPDVIALGYDQAELAEDLENHLTEFNWLIELQALLPFGSSIYHSRLLRKK